MKKDMTVEPEGKAAAKGEEREREKEEEEIPDNSIVVVRYFTSKFPKLLLHTYNVMEECKEEPNFKGFYTRE